MHVRTAPHRMHKRRTQPKSENDPLFIRLQYAQHHVLLLWQAEQVEDASDMTMDWNECDTDEEADCNKYYQ